MGQVNTHNNLVHRIVYSKGLIILFSQNTPVTLELWAQISFCELNSSKPIHICPKMPYKIKFASQNVFDLSKLFGKIGLTSQKGYFVNKGVNFVS